MRSKNYQSIIERMKFIQGIGYGRYIAEYREKKYGPGRRLRAAFLATLAILTLYVWIGIQVAQGASMFVPK